MALRDALEKQRWVAVAVSLVMLACAAAALWLTFRHSSASGVPTKAYFYDMSTDQLFAADRNGMLPAGTAGGATPTGAKIVVAHVFSCGGCEAESERFIAYLETRDPEQPRSRPAGRGASRGADVLVARPDAKDQWFAENTDDGRQIRAEGLARCEDGKAPQGCTPP